MGTVKGDLHDIGKNLVVMLLEGGGFDVVDLGIDVSPEKFVEAIKQHQPQVVGMSALLTTTMREMKNILDAIEENGLRNRQKSLSGEPRLPTDFQKRLARMDMPPTQHPPWTV